jgi:hypothetical protein
VILIPRTVVGVGIQNQLSIRHVLNEIERIHRVHDHIVISAYDQRRLRNVFQISETLAACGSPITDGRNLRWRDLVTNRSVTVLSAREIAFQEGTAGCLALFRIREEDLEPQVLGRIVGGAENRRSLRCNVARAISRTMVTRCGSDQNELANQLGTVERDLLSNHSTDREAENVYLLEP